MFAGIPVRCSSRPATAEAKTLERRKCPKRTRGHEEKSRTCVKPTKRSRKIIECFADLSTPPANVPSIGDQSKQTLRPAASTDAPVTSPKYQQLLQSRPNSTTGAITAPVKHAACATLCVFGLQLFLTVDDCFRACHFSWSGCQSCSFIK